MNGLRVGLCVLWLAASGAPTAFLAQSPDPIPDTVADVEEGSSTTRSVRLLLDAIRDDLMGLRFERALSAIEALLGEPELSAADRGEILVLRSEAHVAFGDLDAAEEDYREILRMRSGFVPDASLTPQKAVERFTRARAELVGDLIVQLEPADARVSVDGRELSIVPEEPVPLLAGEHLIRAEREGFDSLQQTIEIEANREARLELRLVPNARTVVVLTEPEGVDVTLDGAWIGRTAWPTDDEAPSAPRPAELRIENLDLGEHVFELSKPCFRTATFRDLLTVDLLDWSTKPYSPVVLAPVSSTVVPHGGPPGANVLVDGESVGRLPLAPFGVCPGERRVEVRHAGRRIWASVANLTESREWVIEVAPRPNVVLLGADEWPPEFGALASGFNATIESQPPEDASTLESWTARARTLPADTDLAIARTSGTTDGAGVFMLYSPILNAVGPLETARLAVEHPTWSGVAWGLSVADSELSGPALVVHMAASRPGAPSGLRPGDRLVSLGGTQVVSSQQVHRILEVASPNAPLDAEWLSPDGTAHRGQLSGTESARLVPGPADAAGAMVRAAWAVVDSSWDSGVAPLATANLALLLSDFERHELAVQAWKRVVLPERPGIGHGTVQYYLGRALERLGQEREAIRAHTAAAASDATAFDDEGPAIAPAARDRLADLGVSSR